MRRVSTTGGPKSFKGPAQKEGDQRRRDEPPVEGYLLVGHIIKPHGLKGDIRVRVCGYDAESLLCVDEVVLVAGERHRAYGVRKVVERTKDILFRLEGVDTREKGEPLRGAEVWVSRDDLPPLEDDEFYLADALGAAVVDGDGEFLGELVRIEENPAGPLLAIRKRREELLLPAKHPFIRDWLEESNQLVVWVPEGMPRDKIKG